MTDESKPQRASRADAVRTAVDQAFHAGQAQVTRERERAQRQAEGVIGDLAQIATRARETLDELRPSSGEDVRALREAVLALERRVTALEREGSKGSGSKEGSAAKGKSAKGSSGG
ncbi:MAG: hypothetical protein MSC31_16610 [Solirubrobacteraceae bacterium MAG38_C4-C5]|nr:hypothetical protein [Candidatus Siliceabacter maunaloa]